MKKLFLIALIYYAMLSPAQAYLDPGTGSVVLQAIISFLAIAGSTTISFWKKIKKLYSKILLNKLDSKTHK
tara:strand:- start:229 stop:441 length:213 start_codon:yes stop_codon:yes gene_type:complete